MSIGKILDALNENQRIAATFNGTHALVLAGAGTGKHELSLPALATLFIQAC